MPATPLHKYNERVFTMAYFDKDLVWTQTRIKARWSQLFLIMLSVTKLCLTLCNPMDCSTSGSPVLHYLPEFPQIHVLDKEGHKSWKAFFIANSSCTWKRFSQSVQSVQLLSRVQLFATPWIAACQASLSITNSWSSLRLTSIKLVMPSNHLILCHPLFLLPPVPHSIRVFSNESTLRMRWPKYWSCSFNISPSNEYSRLISFRMD